MKKHQSPKTAIRFTRWSRKGYSAFASLHREVTIGVLSVSMSILSLTAAKAETLTAPVPVSVNEELPDSINAAHQLSVVEILSDRQTEMHSTLWQAPLFLRNVEAQVSTQTIESVLLTSPALDIRQRGGEGIQADISIRGGSADQTLVLLNGINFTDVRTGHQSHSLPIDLESVSGMKLLNSYPAIGALAGAININTSPAKERFISANLSGGSYGYTRGAVSGASPLFGLTLFSAASYRRSDGHRHNTDFEDCNGYLRTVGEIGNLGLLDAQIGYQARRFGSNGFYAAYNPNQYERTSTFLGSLRWRKDFNHRAIEFSSGYRKNFDRYDWKRGKATNYHNTDNVTISAKYEEHLSFGNFLLGVNYAYHHIYSTNLGVRQSTPHGRYTHSDERHQIDAFLGYSVSLGDFAITLNGGNSYSDYGNDFIGNLAIGYNISENMSIEGAVNRSLRLPTFTDLYYRSAAQINNPNLRPESAITYRLSSGYRKEWFSARAEVFYRHGLNTIDWVWRDSLNINGEEFTNIWHSEQNSRQASYGGDITLSYSGVGIVRNITLAYGYLNKEKLGGVRTSSTLDFMRHKSSLSGTVGYKKGTLTVTGSYFNRAGGYNLFAGNGTSTVTGFTSFRSYVLLDARLRYNFALFSVFAEAKNITSTNYCDFGGLTMPGATFVGGISVTL